MDYNPKMIKNMIYNTIKAIFQAFHTLEWLQYMQCHQPYLDKYTIELV